MSFISLYRMFTVLNRFKRGNSEGNVHCFYCLYINCFLSPPPPATLDPPPLSVTHAKKTANSLAAACPIDDSGQVITEIKIR